MRRSFIALCLIPFVSCGRSGSGPGGTGPSQSRLASGTPLTIVSGETGEPVVGASVTLGAQALTTDATGQVRLASETASGTPIGIVHAAYLNRESTVRSSSGRFALWPKANAAGLSENYTATIVYTASGENPAPTGDAALSRLPRGATSVVIVPGPEILGDGAALAAHEQAAAAVSAAVGGAVNYTVSASRPGSGVVVTTHVDAQDSRCREGGVRALTRGTYQGLELQNADIVFCNASVARSATVTHEIGHTFGLRHSPDDRDIMYFQFGLARATTFGPRESLVMRLMLDRPAGNRYPDNDRSVVASAATVERVIVCR